MRVCVRVLAHDCACVGGACVWVRVCMCVGVCVLILACMVHVYVCVCSAYVVVWV